MAGHERVSYSLRPATAKRVRDLAKLHGVSVSSVAEELLSDALMQAESIAAATTNPVVMAAVTRALSEPGVLRSMMDVMKSELTDDQLNLFTPPVVPLRPAVLRREGVSKGGGAPAGPKARPKRRRAG